MLLRKVDKIYIEKGKKKKKKWCVILFTRRHCLVFTKRGGK